MRKLLYGYALAIRYIIRNNQWHKIFPRIILATCIQTVQRLTGSIISIRLFNRKKLFLFPGNEISSQFLYTDIPDKEEIQFLRNHTDKHTVFIDLGAHIGSYSVCLADKAMYSIAFEPHPVVVKWCRMNFLLNGMDEHYVHQIALSNKNGTVRFTTDRNQAQNHITVSKTKSIEVISMSLDAFVQNQNLSRKLSYVIKIDVEGEEMNVLKGARQFLQSYPIKGIVYESFGYDVDTIKGFLRKNGFTVQSLSGYNYSAVRN